MEKRTEGNKMRFGDVQDTSKNEKRTEKKGAFTACFIKQLERISFISGEHKLATVNGVTFTI